MRSIKAIEVHESSDSEIEKFLAREDPSYLKPDLSQTYDFIDNLPPFLNIVKFFHGSNSVNNPQTIVGAL
jgi:hypothetical protein